MRVCLSISLFSLFILFSSHAFAGTTVLTTYYPPPAAAYNKVKLATNYSIQASTTGGANGVNFCNSNPVGSTYIYNSQYYVCTTSTTSSIANGIVHTDTQGALHVIMGGQDVIYPQECYNAFCSYDPAVASSCNPTPCTNTPGFTQIPVNSSSSSDKFQTSPHSVIVSIVCCTVSIPATAVVVSTGNPSNEINAAPTGTKVTPS